VQGNTQEFEGLTVTLRGDQGAIYRNAKDEPRRLAVQYRRLTADDIETYTAIEAAGQHMVFVPDALNSPDAVYGVIENRARIVGTVGDGNPPDRYDLGFTFLEELG
jgi:hypothetical protein